MKMKRSVQMLVGLLLASSTQAEVMRITSFSSDGVLTWSNRLPRATYRVEWTPSLAEQWQTNPPSVTVSTTSTILNLELPAYLRVVWIDPPSIRYTTLSGSIPYFGTITCDVDEDGVVDASFYSTIYSIPEGGLDQQVVSVSAHRLNNTPLTAGTMIDSNLTWQGSPQPFAYRNNLFGPFDGPWGGATNAYLPIQILTGSNTNYGWIHIEEYQYLIPGDPDDGDPPDIWATNLRFIDGAYESIPNQGLQAGQTE